MCRRARQCVVREHSHVHARQPARARQLTVAKTAAHGPNAIHYECRCAEPRQTLAPSLAGQLRRQTPRPKTKNL